MSEPDFDGNRYILVCVDSFSRAVELFALSRGDAETVAAALHDLLTRWGRPLEVCCDNAKAFTSSVVENLLKMARVDTAPEWLHTTTTVTVRLRTATAA